MAELAAAWLARYWPLLQRTASAVLSDPDEADDAAQEAALALWRAWDTYRSDRGTRQAWAVTVAQRKAVDRSRRRQVEQRSNARAAAAAEGALPTGQLEADPETVVCTRETLQGAWQTLSATERQMVLLLAEGFTCAAAAQTLRW